MATARRHGGGRGEAGILDGGGGKSRSRTRTSGRTGEKKERKKKWGPHVSMSYFGGDGVAMAVTTPSVVMAVTVIIVWLFHMLLKRSSLGRRLCAATLPSGSMGLPLLGETSRVRRLTCFHFSSDVWKNQTFRYGPVFKTNLVGEDLIVSLDPELNSYVFQQEEKAFQIWYPRSFMRILGDDNIPLSVGPLQKLMRNMALRVFGPENLRQVLLHDAQSAVKRSIESWLEKPSIELKAAASSMIFSVTAKWLIGYKASGSSGDLWKHYDTQGVVTFPISIPGTAFLQMYAEITWEEYKSMKFTSYVIHESLRLANIAPVMFRKLKQDVHIKGYTIPEGWTVMICPAAVHLNPTTYEKPGVFNPWRWKQV
nr:unnamed protein product [Digitaria exilis]